MSLVSTGVVIQHTTCTKSTLNLVPIINGQLIYVSDNNEIYYDTEGVRRPIVDIMILNTQYEFDNLLAPLIKFYFIVETNKFYYYTGTDWILLNAAGNEGYSITWGTITVTSSNWTQKTGYYEKSITLSGSSTSTQVNLMPDITVVNHLISVHCSGIYVENRTGTLYIIAIGNKPTIDLSINYNAYNVGDTLEPQDYNYTNKLDWILFGSSYDYVSQKTGTNPVTWVEQAKNGNTVYATKTSVKTDDTTWTIRYECPSKNIDETFTIINNNGIWTEHKVTT